MPLVRSYIKIWKTISEERWASREFQSPGITSGKVLFLDGFQTLEVLWQVSRYPGLKPFRTLDSTTASVGKSLAPYVQFQKLQYSGSTIVS